MSIGDIILALIVVAVVFFAVRSVFVKKSAKEEITPLENRPALRDGFLCLRNGMLCPAAMVFSLPLRAGVL